jgi:hypothetical protein
MESSVNAMNANSQANNAAEANLVAQKVQARAQYETLEQQRKGRLANAAVSGISDLMKSKKSDQLTKQFKCSFFEENGTTSTKLGMIQLWLQVRQIKSNK